MANPCEEQQPLLHHGVISFSSKTTAAGPGFVPTYLSWLRPAQFSFCFLSSGHTTNLSVSRIRICPYVLSLGKKCHCALLCQEHSLSLSSLLLISSPDPLVQCFSGCGLCPGAAASPGDLIEMHILGLFPTTYSVFGAQNSVLQVLQGVLMHPNI